MHVSILLRNPQLSKLPDQSFLDCPSERYEGGEDTNGSPGRSRPFRASGLQTPGPLEPFPPSDAIQAPQGPSVTGAGKARGQRGRPPARAGNLVRKLLFGTPLFCRNGNTLILSTKIDHFGAKNILGTHFAGKCRLQSQNPESEVSCHKSHRRNLRFWGFSIEVPGEYYLPESFVGSSHGKSK